MATNDWTKIVAGTLRKELPKTCKVRVIGKPVTPTYTIEKITIQTADNYYAVEVCASLSDEYGLEVWGGGGHVLSVDAQDPNSFPQMVKVIRKWLAKRPPNLRGERSTARRTGRRKQSSREA